MMKRAGTWLRDTCTVVMASAMARSTARVKPSRWKYSLPGSVMPLSLVISSCSCRISPLSSSFSAASGSASKNLRLERT
eukprot:2980731-Pleurochrysis_carterae.AAC.1